MKSQQPGPVDRRTTTPVTQARVERASEDEELVVPNTVQSTSIPPKPSTAVNVLISEGIAPTNEHSVGIATGLDPKVGARRRRQPSLGTTVLSSSSRIRDALPLWSDIPRTEQIMLRHVARNFELVDRLLSACVYTRIVSDNLGRVALSERLAPGVDLSSIEFTVARFRLFCRERQPDLATEQEVFRINRTFTNPETEQFFYHAPEELHYYLASQCDLPYWRVVLTHLATLYGTKGHSFDFVRLVVYALESIQRSIRHSLHGNGLDNIRKSVVDGITRRMEALDALLDDAFPGMSRGQLLDASRASAGNLVAAPQAMTRFRVENDTPTQNRESTQDPSIAGMVMISTIVTIPFVGLGWAASNQQTAHVDSNFWFLIPSTLIQLIGVFVVARPLWRSATLEAAWVWIWIWLGITGLASLAAVVFYLTLPPVWSSFASYLATMAQSLLGVQLMFAIPKSSNQ